MCWWQCPQSHAVLYNTLCETKCCRSFFSLFGCCINQCICVLQCWEQLALRCRATAQKRSQPHTDYVPCCDTSPCSTATQPLSALGQTCSLPGKVCSWGKVMEMVEPSEGVVIGTSLHPACLRGQPHQSTGPCIPPQSCWEANPCQFWEMPRESWSCKTAVLWAMFDICSQRITAELVSSINTFVGGTFCRTLSNDSKSLHPSIPRLCASSKKCSHKLIPAALRKIMGPVRLSGRFPLGFLICCSFYM